MVKPYRQRIIWLIKFIPFFQTTYLLSNRLTLSNNLDNYFHNHFADKIHFTYWYITDFTWWSFKTLLVLLVEHSWLSLIIYDFVDHLWILLNTHDFHWSFMTSLIIYEFRWPLMTFVDHLWLLLIAHYLCCSRTTFVGHPTLSNEL